MLSFWDKVKKRAVETEVRRAIVMAKGNLNPDFDVAHPDWVREAQNNNYINLKKKVRESIEKSQARAVERRNKLVGKA